MSSVTLNLTIIECMWLLRRMRAVKSGIQEDLALLRERIHSGYDGQLASAYHALDADESIADGIIRKLWIVAGHPP